MIQAAVFPIPECVCFPGDTIPLHVFEPRYRNMIKHCIEHDLPLAVCHTEKLIRDSKPNQPTEEALNSNQATYKPCDIFSAGRCELVDTLSDGRLMINVHMQYRLRMVNEQQSLPFVIANCEPYEDQPLPEEERLSAQQYQEKVVKRLSAIVHQSDADHTMDEDYWLSLPFDTFSFEIFQLVQFPADSAQMFLEMTSPRERLEHLLAAMA